LILINAAIAQKRNQRIMQRLFQTIGVVSMAVLTLITVGESSAQTSKGLFIGSIFSPDPEGGLCKAFRPQVCSSGRSFVVTILNLSNETYTKGTLVCSLFSKAGHSLIETVTQEV
jgi:hypothetical protein